MSIQRFAIVAGLLAVFAGGVRADELAEVPVASCVVTALDAWAAGGLLDELAAPILAGNLAASIAGEQPIDETAVTAADPRQLLADFALQLLDIRYRRGGRIPATGFDCSGFVHYVFAEVFGVDLPSDSVSQYSSGTRVGKADLLQGDLVFFHIHGKRISHVGIYLGAGRFIHSPTTGRRVRVDSLDTPYWARRFAGARRPDALT
jgi:cell wall-associated NlpC family hydrolase